MSIKLTKYQIEMLWNIVAEPFFYAGERDQGIRYNLDLLRISGLIMANNPNLEDIKLTPDGVVYLSIETGFFDVSEWILLNEESEKARKRYAEISSDERFAYSRVLDELLRARGNT
jgi:hypothetical protein